MPSGGSILQAGWAAVHTNIFDIYLLMVIPVSSASAERSFFIMRRIKMFIIAAMQSTRLSNLALLSIDKRNSEKLLKDPGSRTIRKNEK